MTTSKAHIKKEFDAFAAKIARLEALRHELDALDVKGFENDVRVIRAKLTDVNAIPSIERDLASLRRSIQKKSHGGERHVRSLKKEIARLQTALARKRHLSAHPHLNKQELGFVRDIPKVEHELKALHSSLDSHLRSRHVKVDSGVGVLVDSRFDDFVGSIKAELTQRLKSKQLTMDAKLAHDVRAQEAAFAQKYRGLVEMFKKRYHDRVDHDLKREVRIRFDRALDERLAEEKKRIMKIILQGNLKRLEHDRKALVVRLEQEYHTKEHELKRALARGHADMHRSAVQQRIMVAKRLEILRRAEHLLNTKKKHLTSERTRVEELIQTRERALKRDAAQSRVRDMKSRRLLNRSRIELSREKERVHAALLRDRKIASHKMLADLKERQMRHEKEMKRVHDARAELEQKKKLVIAQLDKAKKNEQAMLAASHRMMEQKMHEHTVQTDAAFKARLEDAKRQMHAQLKRRVFAVARDHESHLTRELKSRENALRAQLDKEYQARYKRMLSQKEADLQRKKLLLEQHVMSHLKKVLR